MLDVQQEAGFPRVLAGVVVFHPDPGDLHALVNDLRKQVAEVMLFFNSPVPEGLRQAFAATPDVSLIEASANLGVGVGLNLLGTAAILRNASAVVFFDQDSTPSAGMIDRLATAWADLQAAGEHPAVVSPVLLAEAGLVSKAPTYRYLGPAAPGDVRRVAFVPTSGSLVATEVLRQTGFFRADFFIDGIDLEWSFRAAGKGYSCWVHTGCEMRHTVGTGVIGSRRLGWSMPKQRPFRMYCVVRNTLYGLRLQHIPTGWKLKQVAYLLLQISAFVLHHRLNWSVTKLLLLGLCDGLLGRLGPPRGLDR